MRKKIIICLLVLLISCGLCFYNATRINTKTLKVREETLSSPKINNDFDGFLIAVFSDLYYGEFADDLFPKLINELQRFKPDIIIFAGDLISPYSSLSESQREQLLTELKKLDAPYGKYAVKGDNDRSDILQEAGFTYLDQRNKLITLNPGSCINLIGLSTSSDDTVAFHGLDSTCFSLVISHYPDQFDTFRNESFDYMVAGHSLGGQVYLPLISLFQRAQGCRKYYRGKTISTDKTLDITNGVGRTLNDARFLSDSEVVFYKLKSGE